jgi:tetratricopeptide (TPR) repeat protein
MPNRTRSSSGDRKVVSIAEAARRRRVKNLDALADAMEGAADETFGGQFTMLGNMNLLEGSFDEAIEAFSRAISLAPDDVNALAGRGQAYRAIGEHALALPDFDRAVALAPGEPRYHLGRSNSLAALGRMDEAVAACTRAIAIAPDSAGAYYTRAVYRSHLEEDDAGVTADLQRAVELAPTEVLYIRQRAEYFMESRDLDRALADIDRALALTPGEARLHYQRGYCLNQLDHARWERGVDYSETKEEARARLEAALGSLERAIELGLQDEHVYHQLVGVREDMGDEAALLATLDRAIAAVPDDVVFHLIRYDRRRRAGDIQGAAADRTRLQELGYKSDLPA